MTKRPFKLGIVGYQPGRSWAARAHVPALRALPDDFEIAGVANSNAESSRRAAAALDLPCAFAGVGELLASPDIDVIAVPVRVPHHRELVKAAIAAGKHVYCEWPLGNGLAEAEELEGIAKAAGVLGVVGTQARVAPEILHMKHLIANGFVGDVLSVTLAGYGGSWGGTVPDRQNGAYTLDRANGATLLTIPLGHTLAAVSEVLGGFSQVGGVLAVRRDMALVLDSGERLPVTAPDQVLISGILANRAPISVHFRGGMPRGGDGLVWEINGTEGDIRLSGSTGHTQYARLSLQGVRGSSATFGQPAQAGNASFQSLDVPEAYYAGLPDDPIVGNVARLYACMARDLREGTHTAPTFEDAVALHRIIAAVEASDSTGRAVRLD